MKTKKYNKGGKAALYDMVKKYAEGGMVSNPKAKKLKLLKAQLSAAKTSRYATEEDRQKDIAMIQRQIRDLGV